MRGGEAEIRLESRRVRVFLSSLVFLCLSRPFFLLARFCIVYRFIKESVFDFWGAVAFRLRWCIQRKERKEERSEKEKRAWTLANEAREGIPFAYV